MTRPAVTVLLVPAGPADRCLERLRPTLGPGDEVVLLDSADPVAVAAAARTATTDLVAELHADVVVTPHWLDRLAAALAAPGVVAAGPRSNAAPPGQALPDAVYDDGRTSLRDFARLRAGRAPEPTPARLPLAALCRLRRRPDVAAGGEPPLAGSVVVHSAYVHHTVADGCPDAQRLPDEPGAPLLSASLIVKDEQECLAACLAAVRAFADEVVVYDTGSTDDTVALARAAGATVIEGFWDEDFGAARTRALEHCSGTWVLVVDADEVALGDPQRLRAALEDSAEDTYAVPIRNLASGGAGSSETHHAHRLFRRAGAMWTGRLHEQLTDRRLGGLLTGALTTDVLIEHSGYTEERFESKDKRRRNLELAEAALREAELAGHAGTSRAIARSNLARAVFAAGDHSRAMGLFERAWDGTLSRTARTLAAAAVVCAGELGDRPAGELWLTRLTATGECGPRVDVLRAHLLGSTGAPEVALAVVEALPHSAVDDDGVLFERASAAALHAGLLGRLGRPAEAADAVLGALRAGVSDWHLSRHLAVLRAGGRTPADLAAALHPRLRLAFLAQCLQVPPVDGWAVLDGLWAVDPAPDLLAVASRLPAALPVPAALEWSARLRARGLVDACPLVRLAEQAHRSGRDRSVAAAVAHVTFADPRALPLLEVALSAVDPADEAGLLAELRVLAPGLVEPVPA